MLRRTIRRLENQFADRPQPAVREVEVEVPVLPEKTLTRLAEQVEHLQQGWTDHAQRLADATQATEAALRDLQQIQQALARHQAGPARETASAAAAPAAPAVIRATSTVPPAARKRNARPAATDTAVPTTDADSVVLRAGARRMVEALGRMAPLRLTRSQWATVAHLKPTSGTWSTYLSDLRRAGLIDENEAGFTLTAAGFDLLGGQPTPLTAAELQDHYRRILRSGAAKMLDVLIRIYPDGIDRADLADAADLSPRSGTFSTYLSDLTRNGLAHRVNGEIALTDVLMHNADAPRNG